MTHAEDPALTDILTTIDHLGTAVDEARALAERALTEPWAGDTDSLARAILGALDTTPDNDGDQYQPGDYYLVTIANHPDDEVAAYRDIYGFWHAAESPAKHRDHEVTVIARLIPEG